MPACPYCEFEISEEYNFCRNCERQVKCTHCGKLLIPGKTRCFVCGNLLISVEPPQTQMNEFTFEEEQTTKSASRRISGRLSDNAFGQAASLFSGIPLSKLVPITESSTLPPPQKLLPAFQENQNEAVEQVVEGSDSLEPSATSLRNDANKDIALQFFEVDGDDELIVKEPDYKGKSKKEQQQRFALMYVWAYRYIFGSTIPSKEHMNNAAKRAGIYDSNWASYFEKTSKEFLMNGGAGYKINSPGMVKVNQIIEEMNDRGVEGFAYWKTTSKSSRKRSLLSKEDEHKIKQWLTIPTIVDEFDVRKVKGAANLAAFAIWIITKQLRVESAVKPKEAYTYLKSKYKTIPVGLPAVSSALSRNSNKFKKTQEGLYFLTEEAELEVEAWVQGAPIQDAELESSDDGEEDTQE